MRAMSSFVLAPVAAATVFPVWRVRKVRGGGVEGAQRELGPGGSDN